MNNVYCKMTLKIIAGFIAVITLICVHVGNHGNLTPLMMENIEALASRSSGTGDGSSSSSGTGMINVMCRGTGAVDCPAVKLKVKEVITETDAMSLFKKNK